MNVLELITKATAILLAAFVATAALRRRGAGLRHFLWTAVFAALLALPFTPILAPAWSVPVPVQVSAPPSHVTVTAIASPVPARPIPWLLLLWAAGCLATTVRFAGGVVRTLRILRRSTAAGVRDRVRIVESPDTQVPMTWGILRPVVILPTGASQWPEPRRQSVLRNEMAHVARRDLLAQTIAQVACCLYWFHPLAWAAFRQLRKERELACDDAVLRQGVAPHDYAAHLMESARNLAPWNDALAMADVSGLEARVAALLDPTRDRRPLSGMAALAVASLVAISVVPVATVPAQAQSATGTIAGQVTDPSGARIPNCKVTARNLDGSNEETAIADSVGEYRFASLPSGRYSVQVAAPGFALAKVELTLVSGAIARSDMHLAVGKVSEAVTVRGTRQGRPAGPAVARAAAPVSADRIRIGGNVMQARLLHQPKPVYSDELKQLGVEGIVKVDAIISKTGSVTTIKVINTADPRLVAAAIDSIKQWQWQPTLLNGEPIEVLTSIDISFQLDK